MKKLSEYKNEEALDILADLLDPSAVILSDNDIRDAWESNNRLLAIKIAIKNHKKEVIDILAIMEGVPRDEYKCNVITLPARLLEILNDEDLIAFFKSQGRNEKEESSGSAMVSTEESEE